jgi:arsenate reductase (thioredoxin)
MAEAIARHAASDVIEATSAGITPLGQVADLTHAILAEKGIESSGLESKGLRAATRLHQPDLIVNMSGMRGKSIFYDRMVEDWDVEDPYGDDLATYRRICEDIEGRVKELAERLRAAAKERTKRVER